MFDILFLVLGMALGAEEHACSGCEDWRHHLPPEVASLEAQLQAEEPIPDRDAERHRRELREDVELGRRLAAQIEKEFPMSENAEVVERVRSIGKELAEIANRHAVQVSWGDARLNPFEYSFFVLKGDDVNAFSIPGGFVYVYEGLVNYAESDHELAGVIAHEISHAAFRHIATLRREQGRLNAITLPLVLIAVLSGGQAGQDLATAAGLLTQAIGSGWSVRAEEAADLGALQYLMRSRFDPTGVLTFMERLAYDERKRLRIDWGIYRTHPPTRERANLLLAHMRTFGVEIRRSRVTTSLACQIRPGDEGSVELWFAGIRLAAFSGTDALVRADAAVPVLNAFFDKVPVLFDLRLGTAEYLPEGASEPRSVPAVMAGSRVLFLITPDDARAAGSDSATLAQRSFEAVRRAVYELRYRTWEAL